MTTSDYGSGALLVLYCLCILVIFAVQLGVVYWVYQDARKRGNPNAVLWAVLTFFSTLIGLILYLILGRNQEAPGGPPTGSSDPGATRRY